MYKRIRDVSEDADLMQPQITKILGMSQTGYSKLLLGSFQGVHSCIGSRERSDYDNDFFSGISAMSDTFVGFHFASSFISLAFGNIGYRAYRCIPSILRRRWSFRRNARDREVRTVLGNSKQGAKGQKGKGDKSL